MREAATVVRLMPSPRNRMTFFALPDIAPLAAAWAAPLRYHHWGLAGRMGDRVDGDLQAGRGRGGVVLAQAPSRVVAQAANRETERRMDAGISQTVTGRSPLPPARHADDTLICRPGGRSAGRLGLSCQHPFLPLWIAYEAGLCLAADSILAARGRWLRARPLAGWALGPAAETWFGPLGELYVTLIKMIAVPLVFFAVINAISSLRQKSVAALSGRTFLWFVITAALAVCVGLGVGTVLQPGGGLQLTMASNYVPREVPSVVQVLLDVVPANVFYALSGIGTKVNAAGETVLAAGRGSILPVIFFAGLVALPSSSWARR